MEILYKDIKDFRAKDIERLFLSVNWESGHYKYRARKPLPMKSVVG